MLRGCPAGAPISRGRLLLGSSLGAGPSTRLSCPPVPGEIPREKTGYPGTPSLVAARIVSFRPKSDTWARNVTSVLAGAGRANSYFVPKLLNRYLYGSAGAPSPQYHYGTPGPGDCCAACRSGGLTAGSARPAPVDFNQPSVRTV